jgi:hypothetical protein
MYKAPVKQVTATTYDRVRKMQARNDTAYRELVEHYQSKIYQLVYLASGIRVNSHVFAFSVGHKIPQPLWGVCDSRPKRLTAQRL